MEERLVSLSASAMHGPRGAEKYRTGPGPKNRDLGAGWLLYAFVRAATPEIIVECGMGGSSVCLLEALRENSDRGLATGHLHTIDPFPAGDVCTNHGYENEWRFHDDGTPYKLEHAYFLNSFYKLGYTGLFTHYYESSKDVGERWDQEIDMLVVDGDHAKDMVKGDWDNFSKWLKPGGFALFHDPIGCLDEVGRLLEKECGDGKEFSMLIEPDNLGLAMVQRKFTCSSKQLWLSGRLAHPSNPQGAETPYQLTNLRRFPGALQKWQGHYFDTTEDMYASHDRMRTLSEKIIASGEEQSLENIKKFIEEDEKEHGE